MQPIYHVEGILNRDFVGQITYTVCLEKPCDKLDIHFCFDSDKIHFQPEDVTDALIQSTKDEVNQNYGFLPDADAAKDIILKSMKTEIHTLATLNDTFIGCIHRQLTDRHMRFDGENTTPGCVPQTHFEGVLKVTVLVFNVIKDTTHYALTVSGE